MNGDSPREGLPRASRELQPPYFSLSDTMLRKPEPLSLAVLLGPVCAEEAGGGGGLCFSLLCSEPWVAWSSEDGEAMLGLPSHLYLWAGAVPGAEVASREPLAGGPVGWSQDALGKQAGKWGLWERELWKGVWAGGAGHFGRAE